MSALHLRRIDQGGDHQAGEGKEREGGNCFFQHLQLGTLFLMTSGSKEQRGIGKGDEEKKFES